MATIATTCGLGAACLRKAAGLTDVVNDVERHELLVGDTRQWFHPECRAQADHAPRTAAVTVGLTATLIADSRHRRASITIQNTGTTAVSIGYGPRALTDLTITSGVKIPAGGSVIDENYRGPIYGMATVATTVNVIEVGQ